MNSAPTMTSHGSCSACANAPASAASAKVRTPANARCGPLPLCRSRSMPIIRPAPSATAKPISCGWSRVAGSAAVTANGSAEGMQQWLRGAVNAATGQSGAQRLRQHQSVEERLDRLRSQPLQQELALRRLDHPEKIERRHRHRAAAAVLAQHTAIEHQRLARRAGEYGAARGHNHRVEKYQVADTFGNAIGDTGNHHTTETVRDQNDVAQIL